MPQYYLRGVINNAKGNGIYNVKIYLSSKGTIPFSSGSSGAFGIPLSVVTDSITLLAEGYETLKTIADTRLFQVFTLKPAAGQVTVTTNKLLSVIQKNNAEKPVNYDHSGESYTTVIENDFTDAGKFPETGFSLNINRASYSNIRRFINMDMKVPPDAVRIEELLNYFDLSKSVQNNTAHFTFKSQLTDAPWNSKNKLLFINLKAPSINVDSVPAVNLIFLIDISGSMDQPNRLPLLKDAFRLLVNNLRPQDTVAIVVYGGTVGTWLQPISGMYKDSIKTSIEKLEAGGETPGGAAIITAYSLAKKIFNYTSVNRILLATDGDFNVGQTSEKELEDIVVAHRQSDIYLTCLGVGMGNYKDSKLEVLAKKGNGNFAYIDNIHEAEKILVTEFTKTMYAVADNAFANIHFNPLYVNRYRLIGFDNKKDLLNDSTSELEGGEVGTGHSFNAVFEIETAGYFNDSLLRNTDPADIAEVILHYKLPENDADISLPFSVQNNYEAFAHCDSALRFATAVIMFGGILKQSDLWQNYTWDDVISIAKSSAKYDSFTETEFVSLLQKAKKIYAPPKKKKKRRNKFDE